MAARYNISVQTLIKRSDGQLFADLGTMVFLEVNEDIRQWIAGSCRSTAIWMAGMDAVTEGEHYFVQYRTIVTNRDTYEVQDTGYVTFDKLSYEDVLRFERYAVGELGTMIEMFADYHSGAQVKTRRRNALFELAKIAWRSTFKK